MTSSDPFSSEHVPDSDASRSDEPVWNQPLAQQPQPDQPAAYPAPGGVNQTEYANPPAYSPPPAPGQPVYAQPAYTPQYPGGYQQPEPRAPLDGVSLAAFITSLIALSPVAVVLAIIGLFRTSKNARSGRWAAWTGLILGILGTIGFVVLILVIVGLQNYADSPTFDTVTTDTGDYTVIVGDANTYGDDPVLDGLWEACDAGDMAACDDLYFESPFGSEYEEFGDNCGTIGRNPSQIFCD